MGEKFANNEEEPRQSEVKTVRPAQTAGYREIRSESGRSVEESRSCVDRLLDRLEETFRPASEETQEPSVRDHERKEIPLHTEVYYTRFEDRQKHTPVDDGRWTGERGLSTCIPSGETEDGRNIINKMAEYGRKGIEYINGEADFSHCSAVSTQIERMTDNRLDNFSQADRNLSGLWSEEGKFSKTDWTEKDVRQWRQENRYTWHERCDLKTMDLVDRDIHEYFRHSGGVMEYNAFHSVKQGGFDE